MVGPDIHEIQIELHGKTFEGAWYVILGDMIVNYNGFTNSVSQPADSQCAVAKQMLHELVLKHYIELDDIPSGLPDKIRMASHKFVNAGFEIEESIKELVLAFGSCEGGQSVHKKLSWLCVNSLSMIVPAWKHMCDGNEAEDRYLIFRRWLAGDLKNVDWSTVSTPMIPLRDGLRIGDCDACRLDPAADAVVATALFLQHADPADAQSAILSTAYAFDEGCQLVGAPDRFEVWLTQEVLPRSIDCLPIQI